MQLCFKPDATMFQAGRNYVSSRSQLCFKLDATKFQAGCNYVSSQTQLCFKQDATMFQVGLAPPSSGSKTWHLHCLTLPASLCPGFVGMND